jgi:GNAT superfamily N-acetyltransferase
LQPEDRPQIKALFERLSPQSLYQRFHSACVRVSTAVLDGVTAGHALVAELEGCIVALVSYHPLRDSSQAEVAIVVDDLNQRRGIGRALYDSLSHDAHRAGIRRLRAELMISNRGMLRLLHSSGLPMTCTVAHDVVEVVVELRHAA